MSALSPAGACIESPKGTCGRAKRPLPSTRYQGSKAKFAEWIGAELVSLDYESLLDLFGGTGSVGYFFKTRGKRVLFNDLLGSNVVNGLALIENDTVRLDSEDIVFLLKRDPRAHYRQTVAREFEGVFYLDEENRWLDTVAQNIPRLRDPYKRALAYRALFQACVIKRPYNLFHRANLNMRTRSVKRTFGNKVTWDVPFEAHFRHFALEGNQAVFSNGHRHGCFQRDALELEARTDLVYIDTPYLNAKGVGVDYLDFYHFLEGLLHYATWPERIDRGKKHRPILHEKPVWCDPKRIHAAFQAVFERFSDSILAVSYRSNGTPSIEELAAALGRVKARVRVAHAEPRAYALSKNSATREVLIIGT